MWHRWDRQHLSKVARRGVSEEKRCLERAWLVTEKGGVEDHVICDLDLCQLVSWVLHSYCSALSLPPYDGAFYLLPYLWVRMCCLNVSNQESVALTFDENEWKCSKAVTDTGGFSKYASAGKITEPRGKVTRAVWSGIRQQRSSKLDSAWGSLGRWEP
jgi:hypothetical protein